ncbi:hypothetical protein D3C81_1998680 [compost metagenome]
MQGDIACFILLQLFPGRILNELQRLQADGKFLGINLLDLPDQRIGILNPLVVQFKRIVDVICQGHVDVLA